jgi:hypothetical protein
MRTQPATEVVGLDAEHLADVHEREHRRDVVVEYPVPRLTDETRTRSTTSLIGEQHTEGVGEHCGRESESGGLAREARY